MQRKHKSFSPLKRLSTIKRMYDGEDRLVYALGKARDLYHDLEIAEYDPVHWRVANENCRWFTTFLPKHCAGSWLGEPPRSPRHKRPPPYHQWKFVLATVIISDGMEAFLAREIPGDIFVEVAIPPRW